MVEETPSKKTGNAGSYPFPSRKDIHGSRIPKAPEAADSESFVEPERSASDSTPALRDSIAPHHLAKSPGQPAWTEGTTAQWGFPPRTAQPGATAPAAGTHKAPSAGQQVQPNPSVALKAPSVTVKADSSPQPGQRVVSPEEHGRHSAGQPRPGVGPVTGSIAVKKGKERKRRKAIKTTLILLGVLALLAVAVWFAVRGLSGSGIQTESDDYPGPGTGEVIVTVESGDHGSDIAQTLYEAGVVKSPAAFIRAFDNNSAASTIWPGNYSLKLEMSAAGALAAMLDETNRSDNTITVNSGQTVAQIKERMVSVGGFTQADVTAAFDDPEAIGLPEVAGGNPEGWPAPGEYEISSSDTPETIVKQMVAATVDTLTTLGVPEDQWMEILTKASILEREAGNHVDLAKVARVIENRLENTDAETVGLLQMDSTVLYGVGKSGGIPTLADLQDDNPYNTYIHKGLPPGPIASPSVEAIEATLNPEEGSWLYFVTVNLDTGETKFADTLAEQEENQKLLDEWCAANGCG